MFAMELFSSAEAIIAIWTRINKSINDDQFKKVLGIVFPDSAQCGYD